MILYIEDNYRIAKNVIAYLETEWFSVKWIADGKQWLEEALHGYFDCLILDVMLPGIDGFSICHELRKHKQIPIIMTTAKWEIDDKSKWFEGWADDYLVKPFELAELVMRIHALLKRSNTSDIVYVWDIEILIDENRCMKNGHEIKLTLKEWQILMELLDAPWITVTRSDIVESVWWEEALFEADGKLDVYMANLRKKLGKEYIETIKWVWYRINM